MVGPSRKELYGDLTLAVAILVGAALLFIGAADLPPPRFEPLGSAALPRILGAFLAIFALIIGGRALFAMSRAAPSVADQPAGTAHPLRALAMLAVIAAYVFSLDTLRIPYVVATIVFAIACGAILSDRRPKTLFLFAVLGVVLAVAIRFVFVRYLYVNLD
ncbi:tripartite tricarboxylate transporter TctB family protein [Consotaella aegiceratis]|uniref:tripartite tricarboxylate transporter TctB family protein n=1 Tax=Consotaella aegiceratis TaxID=3097961 RepID=UPI002F40169A